MLIAPRRTRPLDFSERLIQGGAAGKAPGPNLNLARRVAAFLIAVVWMCAGLAAATIGARDREWVSGVLGAASVVYGLGWVRAAYRGRLAGGRLHLNPWRTE